MYVCVFHTFKVVVAVSFLFIKKKKKRWFLDVFRIFLEGGGGSDWLLGGLTGCPRNK